jgi:hypothetical protein
MSGFDFVQEMSGFDFVQDEFCTFSSFSTGSPHFKKEV